MVLFFECDDYPGIYSFCACTSFRNYAEYKSRKYKTVNNS